MTRHAGSMSVVNRTSSSRVRSYWRAEWNATAWHMCSAKDFYTKSASELELGGGEEDEDDGEKVPVIFPRADEAPLEIVWPALDTQLRNVLAASWTRLGNSLAACETWLGSLLAACCTWAPNPLSVSRNPPCLFCLTRGLSAGWAAASAPRAAKITGMHT